MTTRRTWIVAVALAALLALPGLGQVEPKREGEQRQPRPAAPDAVERYARGTYVWPYDRGPHYGHVAPHEKRSAGTLHTRVGSFRLTGNGLDLPTELTGSTEGKSSGHVIVQLDPDAMAGGAFDELRSTVGEASGSIVRALPVAAFVVRIEFVALPRLSAIPGVLAVEPYHPALKLNPAIGRVPLIDPAQAVSDIYRLELRLFPGEDARPVATEVEALGGSVRSVWPDTIVADVGRARLAELARIEAVEWIAERLPAVPAAEETTTTVQTGRWNAGATPYHDAGVDGGGGGLAAPQVMMFLDTGIQLDAADLADTRTSAGVPGNDPSNADPSGDHRKIVRYQSTDTFGGDGDLLGCDAALNGGFSHGHAVVATALGNASAGLPAGYGPPAYAVDDHGRRWKLDGVAPGARASVFDGQVTPALGSCGDPLRDTIDAGDLYSGGSTGSLGAAHSTDAARVMTLAWGGDANTYTADTQDVDDFLADKRNAMVFVPAGNRGTQPFGGVPAADTLSTLSTSKNGLVVGASGQADDHGDDLLPDSRASFSGVGPAPGNRVAPQLMAPGEDFGDTGVNGATYCRSDDADQSGPVLCDIGTGQTGTSYSAAAAAGAGALVRDWFAQGFYPDGTTSDAANPADIVSDISGTLVKAVLIDSARFLTGSGVTHAYRFNNEQGYGRIRLDRALTLQGWPSSPTGSLVCDGGIDGGRCDLAGLTGALDAVAGETDSTTFVVGDPRQELRVALAWVEASGQALVNDLDLELIAPSGRTYFGNFFTEDDDRDGSLDPPAEDCPGFDGADGSFEESPWSLPVCTRGDAGLPPRDTENPTEAIFLSPDPDGAGNSQIELGTWTLNVIARPGGADAGQRYAVAIVGGVGERSSVRLDRNGYTCADELLVTVNETDDATDPAATLTEAEIGLRTRVQVLSGATVVDEESGLTFARVEIGGDSFAAKLSVTDVTAYDPGNGVLDVRSGDTVRAIYDDETGGVPDAAKGVESLASVDCRTRIGFGGLEFGQFGINGGLLAVGGCERNARGQFEFGFPDRYLDAGENVILRFAFASEEDLDLEGVEVSLRCVDPDADSPADCTPGSDECADPDRRNNTRCNGNPVDDASPAFVEALNSPLIVGALPAGSALSGNFNLRMAAAIPGTPEVELILEAKAGNAGRTVSGVTISRQRLDVDEHSTFYSTDFPTGGTETFDYDNNELIENPTTNLDDVELDYRFETRVYGDLTAGGTKNLALNSPWHFDLNDGGFRSGIGAVTDFDTIDDTITQWGEDLNFNGLNDKRCNAPREDLPCITKTDCLNANPPATDCVSIEDRDPLNGLMSKNWSTSGGCGWQTAAPSSCALDPGGTFCYSDEDCIIGTLDAGPCNAAPGQPAGGVWHTGRIGTTSAANCLVDGNATGQCQTFEIVSGSSGQKTWFELLTTPEIEKVNGPDHRAEITAFSWNAAIDLPDSNVFWTWEVDTDLDTLEPTDLVSDLTILNFGNGGFGAATQEGNYNLTRGFPVFAPIDATGQTENGSVGNNRSGENSCYFDSDEQPFGLAGPPDDDLNNGYCQDTPDNASCLTSADCPAAEPCIFDNALVDEYVKANGPLRNFTLSHYNGPDMRFNNLADLFGPAGDRFQAGIGMLNFEKSSPADPDPATGFGLSIDDVVFEWREFELVDDQTNCNAGSCASIDLSTTNVYGGGSLLTVSVIDASPSPNDCNGDGDNGDPGDDLDCDDDGTPDVRVELSSTAESDPGEFVILDEVAPGEYRGNLPLSTTVDVPGALLIGSGENQTFAGVEATYLDLDDGTGQPCKNDVDPAQHGIVRAGTTVFLKLADLRVTGVALTDNGDGDGWADTNETAVLRLSVFNAGFEDLTGVTAFISSDDAKIDCVLDSAVEIGDLAAGDTTLSSGSARLRVADVDRATSGLGPLDPFEIELAVRFVADGFDATSLPQAIALSIDLDASGGGAPTTYLEGFEVASGFGSFTTMNLDFGMVTGDPLANSDGYRCQFSDPDWVNSNSYNAITDCFVGPTEALADAYNWQVHQPTDIDGGRAFSGTRSLYMGIFGPEADEHTTPLATLEAVGSDQPIDLDSSGPSPELSFVHQVSMYDDGPVDEAPDRGVVMAQLADDGGGAVGDWIKLQPYVNVYDKAGIDNYTNCLFDPIDDGTTEDDFFEPNDPDRRLGPSSTCYPARAFNRLGNTFWPFGTAGPSWDPERLATAEGPGLEGELGVGTWVESRFSLEQFRGRRIRLRFLTTGVKVGTSGTYEQLFSYNPAPGDDGWWIDDVTVSGTLTSPATVTADAKPNTSLPACGNTCNVATADLRTTPTTESPITSIDAPGRAIELNASQSLADQCIAGTLQYRFSNDVSGVLREYTGDATILVAPTADTVYTVEVRCSSDPLCSGFDDLAVAVDCPTSPKTIGFADKNSFTWEVGNVAQDAVFVQGEGRAEIAARAPSIVATPTPTSSAGAHDVSGSTPAPYELEWWLIRTAGDPTPCNVTWSSGGAGEQAGRDAGLP